jgi:hypothetical protein
MLHKPVAWLFSRGFDAQNDATIVFSWLPLETRLQI